MNTAIWQLFWRKLVPFAAGLAVGCTSPSVGLAPKADAAAAADAQVTDSGLNDAVPVADTAMDDGDAAVDDVYVPITLDQWPSLLAGARCDWTLRCGGLPVFGTLEGCIAISVDSDSKEIAALVAAASAGHVSFDVAKAAQCLEDWKALECGAVPSSVACHAALGGSTANGKECGWTSQCGAGSFCKKLDDECATGTCAPTGGEGASCTSAFRSCFAGLTCAGDVCVSAKAKLPKGVKCSQDNQCGVGLVCVRTGNTAAPARCAEPAAQGQGCVDANGCAAGLYCHRDSTTYVRTCQPQAALGAACEQAPDAPGTPTSCVTGTACALVGGSPTCLASAGVGESCSKNEVCAGADLLCRTVGGDGVKQCTLLPVLGQTCSAGGLSAVKPLACMPPALCVKGTCADAPQLGDPCSILCGEGLLCDNTSATCKILPGAGQPCTLNTFCAPHTHCVYTASGNTYNCVAPVCDGSMPDVDAASEIGGDGGADAIEGSDGAPPIDGAADAAAATCGNGSCEKTESNTFCPADCAKNCGNKSCLWETSSDCPIDCYCGNKTCDVGESQILCPSDCTGACGNGKCDKGEGGMVCAADCAKTCGDKTCSWPETSSSCPTDCYCGNGLCDSGESQATCAADCVGTCGDGTCQYSMTEQVSNCAADCWCGNGTCDMNESWDCPKDCYCGDGVCAAKDTVATCASDCCKCGDGVCHGKACGENAAKCPADCAATCGNGTCDALTGETAMKCPDECFCGDGACANDESVEICPIDCCYCGDGFCNLKVCKETPTSCAADCKASCGNGKCEPTLGETQNNCLTDCHCGDGLCYPKQENKFSCAKDCCICGDGTCDVIGCGESPNTCIADCPASCGDAKCSSGESIENCPTDCCLCGDGACNNSACGETYALCKVDCAPCGDNVCEPGETAASCAIDCCGGCGDGKCKCSETAATCPKDCP